MSYINTDELERLRFKFYVDRGYFPTDNTLKRILINRDSINNIKKNKNKIVETIANEEDEYALFVSEVEKLETNKHTDTKKDVVNKDIKNNTNKKIKNKTISSEVDSSIIENYEEQKNEFLSAIKNEYLSYKNKTPDTKKNKVKTFKKPDISKATPKQTIDLHGMTRDKAYIYIKDSIEDAIMHGESPLLVIHGKGLHNEHGRSLVKDSLDEYIVSDNKTLIEYYHKAPKHLGGSGATLLYLRF